MREILKANQYIDSKLRDMNHENRAEKSLEILLAVRNLNDNIALKLYKELYPDKKMGVNKAASQFSTIGKYKFLSKFNKFLQESVSHFTPSEDGAERLMIKYYDYLLQLKIHMLERYNIEILSHINNFITDLDYQTNEYYEKVSREIARINNNTINGNRDIYYIYKCKPFIVNKKFYYEITLEKATDETNKFNRITAFSSCKIDSFYAVDLEITTGKIDMFGINLPILIIKDWNISIRPCELINFSKILGIDLKVQRSYNEYKQLMKLLKDEELNLVDIVSLSLKEFEYIKENFVEKLKTKNSAFFEVLVNVRNVINNNESGKNVLKYLLLRMNNITIKDQFPKKDSKEFKNIKLSTGCFPFDSHPYSFCPLAHITNYYDLLYCFGVDGMEHDILARWINNNTVKNNKLYTSFDELSFFGNKDDIILLINKYNESLNDYFKPNCKLEVYKDYVYKNEYEKETIQIIKLLSIMSKEKSKYNELFINEQIEKIKLLNDDNKLDDPNKEKILVNMFDKSRVHFIYGPAGTGKTKIVNYITYLMHGYNKVFLAKTNAAVVNLSNKVNCSEKQDKFLTVEKFFYENLNQVSYDLIVVDECSTVKNEEIFKILKYSKSAIIVLVGDIYQIEAIGYGNWFNIMKDIMPGYCCHELKNPYRTENEYLLKFWEEVRNINDDNSVLEKMVKEDYSLPLNKEIFKSFNNDEIILCLNYNGLYGLNNINKLMQLSNCNFAVNIGILQYKINDPVLFNDSKRFPCLYNNLKGTIVNIIEKDEYVQFFIEVPITFDISKGKICSGLVLEETKENSSIVTFIVRKEKPYASDNDDLPKDYIVPFQVAYAVSIHKSQGLEFESVKIVIADDSENMINHNIFYTAVTRVRNKLTIYWSPEVCNRILKKIKPNKDTKDYNILKSKMDSKK